MKRILCFGGSGIISQFALWNVSWLFLSNMLSFFCYFNCPGQCPFIDVLFVDRLNGVYCVYCSRDASLRGKFLFIAWCLFLWQAFSWLFPNSSRVGWIAICHRTHPTLQLLAIFQRSPRTSHQPHLPDDERSFHILEIFSTPRNKPRLNPVIKSQKFVLRSLTFIILLAYLCIAWFDASTVRWSPMGSSLHCHVRGIYGTKRERGRETSFKEYKHHILDKDISTICTFFLWVSLLAMSLAVIIQRLR